MSACSKKQAEHEDGTLHYLKFGHVVTAPASTSEGPGHFFIFGFLFFLEGEFCLHVIKSRYKYIFLSNDMF